MLELLVLAAFITLILLGGRGLLNWYRRHRSPSPVKPEVTSSSDESDKTGFSIEDMRILNEESVIISSEEVPLDNRFGSSMLSTELEFSHTATVTMRLDLEQLAEARITGGLRGLIEGQLSGQVQQRQGVDIGQQLTRRATIRFEAAPHRLVRYRIHWMQNRRREIATVRLDSRTLEVPFSLFHGLYHSVESVEVLPND